jgi:hypothetical protein
MENKILANQSPIKVEIPLLNLLDNVPKKSGGIFGFLNKFKENKIYLFIVVGIILGASILYYLYIKNKEKKQAKIDSKKNMTDKNNMMNIVNINEQTKENLLFNSVDKQYYSLDSSGNPIKTTLDAYQNKNQQQQMTQQQMTQQQMTQQQMAQQQMAQQQMAQQQMAQQQMAQKQMAQQQLAQKQMAQQQQAQQKVVPNKNKLKHQVESSSEDDTSETIEYNVNEIDEDQNISQYNLNSDDMNEINSKLSDNN